MPYRTTYDVAQAGFQWWPSLLIALVSALAILFGWAAANSGGDDDNDNHIGGLFLKLGGILGLLVSMAFLAFTYSEYQSAVQALSSHDYSIASGAVANFVHMNGGRYSSSRERFSVNGVPFEYGSGLTSAVFGTYWNDGFIRNGVDVRITYRNHSDDILKVEVR